MHYTDCRAMEHCIRVVLNWCWVDQGQGEEDKEARELDLGRYVFGYRDISWLSISSL